MPNGEVVQHVLSWRVELDGVVVSTVDEVLGLALEVGVVEHQDGSAPAGDVQRLPGAAVWTPVVLRAPHGEASPWWPWLAAVQGGQVVRRTVSVVLHDAAGAEVLRVALVRAWPSRVTVGLRPPGTGADAAPRRLVEEVTLVHEGLRRGPEPAAGTGRRRVGVRVPRVLRPPPG